MDLFAPLAIGFFIGLSGAMLPGPLLVYTITESLKRGWTTGVKVIIGHSGVEIILITAIIIGLSDLIGSKLFIVTSAIIGALVMTYMAWSILWADLANVDQERLGHHGAIFGGAMFSAFNPSFILWWATAGMALLAESMRLWGLKGAVLVVIGHWIADLAYYSLVSILVSRGRKTLIRSHLKQIKIVLCGGLLMISVYFASVAASGIIS